MKRFKRFWWIILVIIIAAAVLFAIANYMQVLQLKKDVNELKNSFKIEGDSSTQNDSKPSDAKENKSEKGEMPEYFSNEELKKAEEAFAKGIKIDDPQNDFYKFPPNSIQPDGRLDNPNSYPLPYTDLKSLVVGADNNYIYFKFEFWGQFPEDTPEYNNDILISTGGKIEEFTYTDKDGYKDSAELGDSVGYVRYLDNGAFTKAKSTLGQLAMISPVGQDELLETIYKTKNGKGLINGGPNYDYIIGAYPLNLFGINYGDVVTFKCSTETGSQMFHHECIDLLLSIEGSKFGSTIEYKLGSNQYGVLKSEYK
jgi:hypothetical protein